LRAGCNLPALIQGKAAALRNRAHVRRACLADLARFEIAWRPPLKRRGYRAFALVLAAARLLRGAALAAGIDFESVASSAILLAISQ
jgi:hypothetical protein